MKRCKVCGKIIEDEITFSNLFALKNYYHNFCKSIIKINDVTEVIPTDFGYLKYTSKYINKNFNDLVFFEKNSYKYFEKILLELKKSEIIIIVNQVLLNMINYEEMLLLSALSKVGIKLVSLLYLDLIEYDNIFTKSS